MSKEVRCIMFSAEDTHAAVASFLGRKLKGLDPYAVHRVELSSQDGAVSARVSLSGERTGDAPTLDPNEIMAAMLMHCRGQRIPLSNRSTKKIELSEGRLVLVMSMNFESVQPAVGKGAVVYTPADDRRFASESHYGKRL